MSPRDPEQPEEKPSYRVYRSRRRPLSRLRKQALRLQGPRPEGDDTRPGLPRLGRRGREAAGGPEPRRRRLSRRRLTRWLIVWAILWTLLSALLFAVSAQIQTTKLSDGAREVLGGGSNLLTKPATILVLGSDRRPKGSREPGAQTSGPGRADTIMLLRTGGGRAARLSIPRDTFAPIPGAAAQKINAAYAIGGAALEIQTVEQFLGIDIDHVIEVDFEGFSKFIDALGGVRIELGRCVVSRINGGFRNGGYTLRLRRGTNTIDGRQALALARTRRNECAPGEDDRTRARRQQLILSAVRDRLTSPLRFPRNFIFGPWIGWTAPQAIVSDMGGPTMGQLGLLTVGGPDSTPRVLRPSGFGPGGSLIVSQEEKQQAVRRFLEG